MIANGLALAIGEAEIRVAAGRAGHVVVLRQDRVKEKEASEFHFFGGRNICICFIDWGKVTLQSAIGWFHAA